MWNLILSCAAMLILFFCILLLAFCGKRICVTGSPLSQCHVVISCTPFRLHTYNKYSIYILYNMNCIFTFIQWKKIFFSWFTWWNITYMYMYIDVSRWSINKKKTSVYRNTIICCFVFNTTRALCWFWVYRQNMNKNDVYIIYAADFLGEDFPHSYSF